MLLDSHMSIVLEIENPEDQNYWYQYSTCYKTIASVLFERRQGLRTSSIDINTWCIMGQSSVYSTFSKDFKPRISVLLMSILDLLRENHLSIVPAITRPDYQFWWYQYSAYYRPTIRLLYLFQGFRNLIFISIDVNTWDITGKKSVYYSRDVKAWISWLLISSSIYCSRDFKICMSLLLISILWDTTGQSSVY